VAVPAVPAPVGPTVRLHGRATRLSTITVSGVSRSFAARGSRLLALEGVTFTVPVRQVVAIVGPNGCGKSTLLRLISGLLAPDRGRVLIGDEPVDAPDPRVGLVFQEPRLLPWRSTLDNIAFPLELAGQDPATRERRARELVQLVGLEGFEDARPHQLSGGMRQRAGIARALALAPSVLLLDEPFSALDALTRERFDEELLGLWAATATTVVLVTHSIAEAIHLADRVLVMSPRPGRIVADVPITAPRPRSGAELDVAELTQAAANIRAHLGLPVGTRANPMLAGARNVAPDDAAAMPR
jgi:NitT/TauT family transport system ATP-binding protein